jgi:hypothetical protein
MRFNIMAAKTYPTRLSENQKLAFLTKERRNNKLNNLADSFAFIKNFFFVNYSR